MRIKISLPAALLLAIFAFSAPNAYTASATKRRVINHDLLEILENENLGCVEFICNDGWLPTLSNFGFTPDKAEYRREWNKQTGDPINFTDYVFSRNIDGRVVSFQISLSESDMKCYDALMIIYDPEELRQFVEALQTLGFTLNKEGAYSSREYPDRLIYVKGNEIRFKSTINNK